MSGSKARRGPGAGDEGGDGGGSDGGGAGGGGRVVRLEQVGAGAGTSAAGAAGGVVLGPEGAGGGSARAAWRWGDGGMQGGMASGVRSLYIHTPFCVHKCHYCDFYSFVDNRDQQGAFVERLTAELRALAVHARDEAGRKVRLESIFVGGGTPSLLRTDLWERVLGVLHEGFDLSGMGAGGERERGARGEGREGGEFTVECNPESTTAELLKVLVAGGVNRVSVGAQSFDTRHLATLERWHEPVNVERAIRLAQEAGVARQSVDLIFGVPGQSVAEWRADLERALALGTGHLSCYNLTYEPNTAMTVRLKRGEFVPADEDTEAEMFELTGKVLADAGLGRYEVSNYARAGQESRHNLVYWRQGQWLAAGPSASGHVWAGGGAGGGAKGGWRWKNVANLGTYLSRSDGGYAPATDVEAPDAGRAVRERLMTGLRLAEGVDGAAVMADAEAACPGSGERLAAKWAEFAGDGLLREEEGVRGRWRVSERGWLLADFVAKRLMACVG
ncbi:MAG: radical SAM family heme chaperone HemW [bacterium]